MVRASHVTHRARSYLPPTSDVVGNFYDISLCSALQCHDDDGDGLRGSDELPPGRVGAIVRFRSARRPAEGGRESRKGKERLESCNAQTATKPVMCQVTVGP